MSKRNIGNMGEAFIEHLIHENGCIPNRVHYDYGGWDMFLQIPYNSERIQKSYPLDLHPPEISCLLQIKTTDEATGYIDNVKLSNWVRFAKNPSPCFFIILEYLKQNSPQNIYVVHVDEVLITKALKRIRKLRIEDFSKLHRKKMRLHYYDDHMLSTNHGDEIINVIKEAIGPDIRKYIEKKIWTIANVGYDDKRIRGTIKFPAMKQDKFIRTLVKFALGYISEIPVESVYAEEVRFDIPHQIDPPPAYNEIKLVRPNDPPSKEVEVTITKEEEILFTDEFSLISPFTVFPFIPVEYCQFRLVSEYLDILFDLSNNRADYKVNIFKTEKAVPLVLLNKLVTFLKISINPKITLYKINIWLGNKNIDLDCTDTILKPSETIVNLIQAVESLNLIINQMGCYHELSITLKDIDKQFKRIKLFKQIFSNIRESNFSFIANRTIDNLDKLAVIFCQAIHFQKYSFIVTCSYEGKGQIDNNTEKKILISNGKFRVIKKQIVPISKTKTFNVDKEVDKAYQYLSNLNLQPVTLQ